MLKASDKHKKLKIALFLCLFIAVIIVLDLLNNKEYPGYFCYEFGGKTYTEIIIGYKDQRYVLDKDMNGPLPDNMVGRRIATTKAYCGRYIYKIKGKDIKDSIYVVHADWGEEYAWYEYINSKYVKDYKYKYAVIGQIVSIENNSDYLAVTVNSTHDDDIYETAVLKIDNTVAVREEYTAMKTADLKVGTEIKVEVNTSESNYFDSEDIELISIIHGDNIYIGQEYLDKYMK